MGKVVVTEFITLDGVVEKPQNWSSAYWGDDIAEVKNDELSSSDALLLGRTTYTEFADSWPQRAGDPFADRFNAIPKYVVSSSADTPWNNTTVIGSDLAAEVEALKEQYDGDITVHGSATLAAALLDAGLVDQLNLITYPVALGTGKRLFKDGVTTRLALAESRPFSSGAVLSVYRRADEA